MKRLFLVLLACSSFALSSTAGEVQRLALPSGRSAVVNLPFVSAGYKVSGDVANAVSVTVKEGSSTAVVSAGGKAGRCQITFRDAEGEECVVLLEVLDEIDELLPRLRKHLSGFDGLKVERAGARIAVSGTIGNSSDWGRFERILAMADFHKKVDDRVEFRIAQTELDALADQLRKAGVPVAESTAQQDKGEVFLDYRSGDVLEVSGIVWSTNQVIVIRDVLRKTRWSKIVEEIPDDARFSPFVPTILNLAVADDLLAILIDLVILVPDRLGDGSPPSVQAILSLLSGNGHRSGNGAFMLDGSITNVLAALRNTNMSLAEIHRQSFHMLVRSGQKASDYSPNMALKLSGQASLVDENHAEVNVSMDIFGRSNKEQGGIVAVSEPSLRCRCKSPVVVELKRPVVLWVVSESEEIRSDANGRYEYPVYLIIASVRRWEE